MFYQIFLSPQVTRCVIITYKHGIYELSNELPNATSHQNQSYSQMPATDQPAQRPKQEAKQRYPTSMTPGKPQAESLQGSAQKNQTPLRDGPIQNPVKHLRQLIRPILLSWIYFLTKISKKNKPFTSETKSLLFVFLSHCQFKSTHKTGTKINQTKFTLIPIDKIQMV